MTKAHTNLTIDEDLLIEAKKLHINISETLNDALKAKIAISTGNLEDINEELLRLEVQKLQNSVSRDTIILKSKLEDLKKIEGMSENKKEAELLRQKKMLEEANKCINCHKIFTAKESRKKFDKGMVCNSCFQNYGSEKFKEWSMEAL